MIPEVDNEDCEMRIHEFFVKDLKMDKAEVDIIKIVRCHRLNKAKEEKIRTIICRFHFHGDRENVKKRIPFERQRYKNIRGLPKGNSCTVQSTCSIYV